MRLYFLITIICSCTKLSPATIVNITRENFDELIENSTEPWLVNFCSHLTKDCKNALSEFLKASKILDRYMKLGFINVDEEVHLNYRFSVSRVPKILLFGYDKAHPKDFEGFKTVRGFTMAALKIMEDDINEQIKPRFVRHNTVQELDEYSFKKLLSTNKAHKDWCVVNYSSGCADCLKFSEIFKRLSEYFKHGFHFGAIDVLKHSHDLDKYPQVRHYISEHSMQKYSGELIFEGLEEWLNGFLSDPLVVQLTSRKVLENACQHKKYCMLVSMPSLEDLNATYRTNFIEDLQQKALKSKHLSLGWLWFETGEQIHLERVLNISESAVVVFTVVHVKKLIYHRMQQYKKDNYDTLDKMLGHVMDDTDFKVIIEATEFPKIFRVTPWEKEDFGVNEKVKSEL